MAEKSYEYVGPGGKEVNDAIKRNRTTPSTALVDLNCILEENLGKPVVGNKTQQLHVESLGILEAREAGLKK
jgi:hypothetical protein